jgi:hypothetical protein
MPLQPGIGVVTIILVVIQAQLVLGMELVLQTGLLIGQNNYFEN